MSRANKNKIYGSAIYTYKPVISANSVYIEDFKDNEQAFYDVPFNYIRVRNSSNSDLLFKLENTPYTIGSNETLIIDDKVFSHIEIITNSIDINENDLIINVQVQAMNSDTYSRIEYEKNNSTSNKLKKTAVAILGGLL